MSFIPQCQLPLESVHGTPIYVFFNETTFADHSGSLLSVGKISSAQGVDGCCGSDSGMCVCLSVCMIGGGGEGLRQF